MTSTTTSPSSPVGGPLAARAPTGRGAAIGVGLALALDTLVYVIGNVGAPIRVVTGWAPDGADMSYAEVVLTTLVAVLAGAVVLWWLERRRGGDGFRAWTVLVAVVAVASALPLLRLEVDAGSKLCLVAMHLLTGAAAIAGQAMARRRASDPVRPHQK